MTLWGLDWDKLNKIKINNLKDQCWNSIYMRVIQLLAECFHKLKASTILQPPIGLNWLLLTASFYGRISDTMLYSRSHQLAILAKVTSTVTHTLLMAPVNWQLLLGLSCTSPFNLLYFSSLGHLRGIYFSNTFLLAPLFDKLNSQLCGRYLICARRALHVVKL